VVSGLGGELDDRSIPKAHSCNSLVAIMLGRLRMSIEEAIDGLITVAITVFLGGSWDPNAAEGNSKRLKEAIEDLLRTRGIPTATKMHERDAPHPTCKVSVCYLHYLFPQLNFSRLLYAATSANTNHPQAFCTYSPRGYALNPTIVEALCATMTIPSLFSPVKIGRRLREQSFIGGPLGGNNPTRELLNEARSIFGADRRVAQIISIGSGLPRVLSMESPTNVDAVHRLLTEIATDCEGVARELFTRLFNIDAYLRLNVDRGMEDITVQDWGRLGDIESHTTAYIATTVVTQALDGSIRRMVKKKGMVSLGQLSEYPRVKNCVRGT